MKRGINLRQTFNIEISLSNVTYLSFIYKNDYLTKFFKIHEYYF